MQVIKGQVKMSQAQEIACGKAQEVEKESGFWWTPNIFNAVTS